MDADPMTKTDQIPPPSVADNDVSLSWWMRHSEEPRAWGMSPHVGSAMQSLIRRCHAAEAEVARLRNLVGYDKVTLNTILEEHHAEAGRLAEDNARLRAEAKNLTAERDLARSNYEITRLAEAERLLQDLRPVLQTGAWGDMIAAFLARTTPKADVTINGLGVSSWADHADKTPNEELSAGAKEVAVEVEGYL